MFNSTYKDFSRTTVGDKKLLDTKDMNETHLINTIRYEFNHNNVSEEYIEKWEKRKLDCKMELMKRWTEELQENGIQPKIVFKEPESKHNKKYKLSLLSNEAVIDAVFKN